MNEGLMASNEVAAGGHPDMDYAEHERTYRGFLTFAKIGIVFVIALLVFMAVTLL
jgi:hypothetical protein